VPVQSAQRVLLSLFSVAPDDEFGANLQRVFPVAGADAVTIRVQLFQVLLYLSQGL
jgi:hypothetical protein